MLVVATDGEAGLSAEPGALGETRRGELERAARALGVARVVRLGYADSGLRGDASPDLQARAARFCDASPTEISARLADVLREEQADILLTYDSHGGYGHPDHLQVHRTGALAADLAGTPAVFEATIDRRLLLRLAKILGFVPGVRRLVPADGFASAFTEHSRITHRIDVRRQVRHKQRALRAHASQATGASVRTVGLLARLPRPFSTLVLGTEWFTRVR